MISPLFEEKAMDIATAVKTCLTRKYADFSGRASPAEFWGFALFIFGVHVLGDIIFRQGTMVLVVFALILPSIAVTARRLHDTGRSGWVQVLLLVPVLGWAVLIYFVAQQGDPQANHHGPAPATDASPAAA
jgi:uncharacterized membrane protein YhaH (DUF805 family)